MIWIILLITLGLRLVGINQSLWLDETISANVAKLPIGQIINQFSVNDFHPPFYYWSLDLWVKFFGSQVWMMRLSSILFSLVVVFGVYKIGEKLEGKKIGLWAAWFTAINPLMVYYGQELRMYLMMTMWLVWVVYYWIKIIKDKKIFLKDWVLFNIFCFLALITFYASIFLIGAMILYFLIKKEWKNFGKSVFGLVVAILMVSPLLLNQLKMSAEALKAVTNWSLVLGKVNLKNLLLIPLKFCIGRVSWQPKIFYYSISGIWTVLVWLIALKNSKKNNFLTWLMVIPLFLAMMVSIKSPMIQYFRFLYLVPVLMLFLAKEKNKIIKLVLSIGFLGFSLFYILNPNMYREDWKGLAESLRDTQEVYMIGSFADPIKFYKPIILIKDITKIDPTEGQITLIPYGEMIHGIDTKEKMEKLGYQLIEQNNFRGLVLEKWQKTD